MAIAGGGPAGLAVAIEAARRGVSVVVLERLIANPRRFEAVLAAVTG